MHLGWGVSSLGEAMTKRAISTLSLPFAVALLLTIAASLASATAAQIVAFGASNTAGHGVGSDRAWPARLQAMLRAKGYQANRRQCGHQWRYHRGHAGAA